MPSLPLEAINQKIRALQCNWLNPPETPGDYLSCLINEAALQLENANDQSGTLLRYRIERAKNCIEATIVILDANPMACVTPFDVLEGKKEEI